MANKDVNAVGQPIYRLPRPITPRPRQELDSILAMLPRQPVPTKPFELSNLILATALSYQHKNVSGYPMQAAFLNSQSWRQQLSITNIAQQPGMQWTAARVAADLKHRCNQMTPGVIKSFPMEKATIINRSKIPFISYSQW